LKREGKKLATVAIGDFEERADQLSLADIDATLADGAVFRNAQTKLLARGAKLLKGPRGTGKTHVMRYTYAKALVNQSDPLVLYSNFSRYLCLEPLLTTVPDAVQRFHSWVLAKIILSAFQFCDDKGLSHPGSLPGNGKTFSHSQISQYVELLEKGTAGDSYTEFGRFITANDAIDVIRQLASRAGRSRCVLLLDDAALSLSESYLIEFFRVFRILKTEFISPKASVYPGTTQYGPSFHVGHEVEEIELWLSVEDGTYQDVMEEIRLKRGAFSNVSKDVSDALKYIAFGIPRAYLRLLRDFGKATSTSLAKNFNEVVQAHVAYLDAEYESLQLKLPQFKSVIQVGENFFKGVIDAIAQSQAADGSARQIWFGLKEEHRHNPLDERMIRFLVEVGLLYPIVRVSHGAERTYERFIPHLAYLHNRRVFGSGQSSSPKSWLAYMQRPQLKQPVRRSFGTILEPQDIARLKLDLPTCKKCGAERISESQKYCHACGQELVDSSLFNACMALPLSKVPGISPRIMSRIKEGTKFKTIGDIHASQNAYGELMNADYVGPYRAEELLKKVAKIVDEFLS